MQLVERVQNCCRAVVLLRYAISNKTKMEEYLNERDFPNRRPSSRVLFGDGINFESLVSVTVVNSGKNLHFKQPLTYIAHNGYKDSFLIFCLKMAGQRASLSKPGQKRLSHSRFPSPWAGLVLLRTKYSNSIQYLVSKNRKKISWYGGTSILRSVRTLRRTFHWIILSMVRRFCIRRPFYREKVVRYIDTGPYVECDASEILVGHF